jgi:hypothetical protein
MMVKVHTIIICLRLYKEREREGGGEGGVYKVVVIGVFFIK